MSSRDSAAIGAARIASSAPLTPHSDGTPEVSPRGPGTGRKWLYDAAAGAAFLVAVAARVVTFLDPWVGAHNAWGGAFYSNVARNFVRYGLETRLAPVVSTGVVDPAQFEVYYHHPVLSMLLTSVSFRLFGEHEWSARIGPLVFSILTLLLVFRMARRLFGDGTALLAMAFMAVLPVDAYYAMHLDPYGSMAIFLTVLAVAAYERWFTEGRGRHLAVCVAAIALGCMTSWFTYLVVPGIGLHWLITRRSGARLADWARIASLPATAVAMFGVFLLHRRIALMGAGPEVYDGLGDRLIMRSVELPLSRIEILDLYLWQVRDLYTMPVVLLMIAWVGVFARRAWKRQLSVGDWCVAILLSYGFLYALAFPGHLPAHDYFVRAYAPGIAIAAAVVVTRFTAAIRTPYRDVVAAAIVLGVAAVTLPRLRALYASDNHEFAPRFKGYARAIAAVTSPRDRVLMPGRGDRIMEYYVDRPFTFELDTPAKLDSAIAAAPRGSIVAVPDRDSEKFAIVLQALRGRFAEERSAGLHLFLLSRPPAD